MQKQSTYIIAEAGVNHNGDMNRALQLIDAAADAGADAVKFQTFIAKELVSHSAPKAEYQKHTTDNTESQLAMLEKLELSFADHFILKTQCEKRNITFLSTPFDSVSADFLLNKMQLSIIKIASGEITTAPLLLQIAKRDVAIILSTGMSTLSDIEDALSVMAFGFLNSEDKPSKTAFAKAYASPEGQKKLKEKVTLLHCTSNYPANINSINLRAMDTLQFAFDLPVGYSDHSMGITVPIAAVALGARVIEKHFTLDRNLQGPDHQASLEPHELKNMVQAIRDVECALGNAKKIPTPDELDTKSVARKSITAITAIAKGEIFCEKNIGVQRPGVGIAPIHYWDYLKRTATKDYKIGELIYE